MKKLKKRMALAPVSLKRKSTQAELKNGSISGDRATPTTQLSPKEKLISTSPTEPLIPTVPVSRCIPATQESQSISTAPDRRSIESEPKEQSITGEPKKRSWLTASKNRPVSTAQKSPSITKALKRRSTLTALLLLNVLGLFAQGNGVSGITDATGMVSSYFDPATKLIYAIGAVVGLIGGVKVYGKFSSGDPDTSKTAASWFGACIFLIVAATVLRSFFL